MILHEGIEQFIVCPFVHNLEWHMMIEYRTADFQSGKVCGKNNHALAQLLGLLQML